MSFFLSNSGLFQSFLVLAIIMDIDTFSFVNLLKALEEVEKNFATMRCMLSGDGEVEPNPEQVSQLASEVCKEDVLALLIHKLPILGWEVSY